MITDYKIKGKPVYQFVFDFIDSNMYIMIDSNSAVVIDPVLSSEAEELLSGHHISKLWIMLTHEHYDHIIGLNRLREQFDCCVIGSEKALEAICDPKKNLAIFLEGAAALRQLGDDWREVYQIPEDYSCLGDIGICKEGVFHWNDCLFRIHETPGHSPGSVCISVDYRYYFTGDSLVDGHDIILRLPGGDKKAYNTITRPYLEAIPPGAVVFPGHGNPGNIDSFHIV